MRGLKHYIGTIRFQPSHAIGESTTFPADNFGEDQSFFTSPSKSSPYKQTLIKIQHLSNIEETDPKTKPSSKYSTDDAQYVAEENLEKSGLLQAFEYLYRYRNISIIKENEVDVKLTEYKILSTS